MHFGQKNAFFQYILKFFKIYDQSTTPPPVILGMYTADKIFLRLY